MLNPISKLTTASETRALSLGLIAVLLWSTVATAFKMSLAYLNPLELVFYASIASWCVLGLLLVGRKASAKTVATRRQYLNALVFGLINPVLYYLVLFQAYDRLPAQEAMAINYSWALTLPLLAAAIYKQPLNRQELLAAFISYGGILVIATRGDLTIWSFQDPIGIGLAVGSTVIWALYWLATARLPLEATFSLFLGFSSAIPVTGLLLYARGDWMLPPLQGLLGAAYVGCFEMGFAFWCWLGAMQQTRNTLRLSSLIFLAPPLSLLFIATIVGEPIQVSTMAGLAAILCGLLIQHWVRKRQATTDAVASH